MIRCKYNFIEIAGNEKEIMEYVKTNNFNSEKRFLKFMKTKDIHLKKSVKHKEFLRSKGIKHFVGIPDFFQLLRIPPKYLDERIRFIELKTGTDGLHHSQIAWLDLYSHRHEVIITWFEFDKKTMKKFNGLSWDKVKEKWGKNYFQEAKN